jgi:hypothetical protein
MNWYKVALRGNIERMNDPFKDPYRKQSPIPADNGDGYKYTIPGDETYEGSMGGTRARNDFPKGWSSTSDEYDLQRRRDIPSSSHMFISNDPRHQDTTMKGLGSGIDSMKRQDFTDIRDRLPTERQTFGPDPIGPSNMSHIPEVDNLQQNLFQRIKSRIKGAYL